MTRKRCWGSEHLFAVTSILVLLGATAVLSAQQPSEGSSAKIKTSGRSLRPQQETDKERQGLVPPSVPYPGSLDPIEVVQNIRAILRHRGTAELAEIPELSTTSELRAARILQVQSTLLPPGYLVVELVDARGNRIANFAMTPSGHFIMLEDMRHDRKPRPLGLTDAASRVRSKRGRPPQSVRYVYFHNVAERGLSLCRPLVAVKTEKGDIFLNSEGEAFVEDGSEIASELQSAGISKASPNLAMRLRSVGRW